VTDSDGWEGGGFNKIGKSADVIYGRPLSELSFIVTSYYVTIAGIFSRKP